MFKFGVSILAALLLVGTANVSSGRGFGGFHGGGLGGGGFRGGSVGGGFHGGAMPHVPRPASRPNLGGARPGGVGGLGSRPGGGLENRPGGVGGLGNRPGGIGGLGNRPGGGLEHRPGGVSGLGSRPVGGLANRPGAAPTRNRLNSFLGMPSDAGLHSVARAGNFHRLPAVSHSNLHSSAYEVRRNLRVAGGYRGYYTGAWYRRYPNAWYNQRWLLADMWAYADWRYLSGYYSYGSVAPMYYDYGTNVTYNNDGNVYVQDQNVGTTQEYYDQAADLASTGIKAQPDDSEKWLPLGVFAVSDGQTKTKQLLQLAVNKESVIRGNYTVGDKTDPIHGSIDKKTQRAAWTVGDDTKTVYETGLYNLTKDEASAIVHNGSDDTQQLTLVRLKNSDKK